MKKKICSVLFILVLALSFSLVTATPASATAITSAATGNWNAGATWVGGVVPVAGDAVTIATGGRNTILRISTGTASFSGNITFSGTAAQAQFTFTGAGTLNIGGNFGSGGTLTGGTSTIVFNNNGSQSMGAYTMT